MAKKVVALASIIPYNKIMMTQHNSLRPQIIANLLRDGGDLMGYFEGASLEDMRNFEPEARRLATVVSKGDRVSIMEALSEAIIFTGEKLDAANNDRARARMERRLEALDNLHVAFVL